jgi:hypothetical protein
MLFTVFRLTLKCLKKSWSAHYLAWRYSPDQGFVATFPHRVIEKLSTEMAWNDAQLQLKLGSLLQIQKSAFHFMHVGVDIYQGGSTTPPAAPPTHKWSLWFEETWDCINGFVVILICPLSIVERDGVRHECPGGRPKSHLLLQEREDHVVTPLSRGTIHHRQYQYLVNVDMIIFITIFTKITISITIESFTRLTVGVDQSLA